MAENRYDYADSDDPIDTPLSYYDYLVTKWFQQPEEYRVQRSKGSNDWLFTYTRSGRGRFRLNRETIECGKGDIVLIRPNIPHDYATNEGEVWDFWWAHFQPAPHWLPWLRWPSAMQGDPVNGEGVHKVHISAADLRKTLEQLFDRIENEMSGNLPLGGELAHYLLGEAMLLITRDTLTGMRNGIDSRILMIVDWMGKRLADQHSVQSLAERIHLSPSRFVHLFKDQIGESLMQVLTSMRLKQGARLLIATKLPIRNIAEEVGFPDTYYFSRKFKRMYGVTPGEFRKGQRRPQ